MEWFFQYQSNSFMVFIALALLAAVAVIVWYIIKMGNDKRPGTSPLSSADKNMLKR